MPSERPQIGFQEYRDVITTYMYPEITLPSGKVIILDPETEKKMWLSSRSVMTCPWPKIGSPERGPRDPEKEKLLMELYWENGGRETLQF